MPIRLERPYVGGGIPIPSDVQIYLESRQQLEMTWTGWDNSVWTLTNPDSGLFLVQGGVRGLNKPTFTRHTSVAPGLAGSRWRGRRTEEREVFWPLYLYSDGDALDFGLRDSAFWATMHPDRPGVWSVRHPNGTVRRLRCRFTSDGDQAFERDPFAFGWTTYGITLIAEQPFWEGPDYTRTWAAEGAVDFLGGPGVINISSSNTTADAVVRNDGDEDSWLVWRVRGPIASAQLEVNGKIVPIPFAISGNRELVIDTRPDRQVAVEQDVQTDTVPAGTNTVERTGDLGLADFTPIPTGIDLPIGIDLNGGGLTTAVTASFTPLYHRAF